MNEKQNYLDEILENIPREFVYSYTDIVFGRISCEDAFNSDNRIKAYYLQDELRQKGMYAVITWQWVKPLAKWIGDRRCLEVMSGRGWLSLALRSQGVNIISTDDYSWADTIQWGESVTEVERLDAIEAVNKYGKDIEILICAWPYMDDTAFRTISALHVINPDALIIYIGEFDGGCTADDNFHKHFQTIKDEEFHRVADMYQRWPSLHDFVYLGKYSKNKRR